MTRRFRIHALVASAILTLCGTTAPAWAQASGAAFPNRPITLLVPYPAGGPSDVSARIVAPVLSRHLGQAVVVENLGGAGGAIAAQKALSAAADGHLLFQGSPNELILAPLTNAAVKFKSEDFRAVQMLAIANMAVLARKDVPASNGDELAAYARKRAAEGKPLTYGSVGPGSFYHLLGAQLAKQIDVEMTHVPYKGAAAVQQDLIGGVVDLLVTPFGKPEMALAQQGRLKIVATLTPERLDNLKQVPTLAESKALKGFTYSIWGGYFVKKGTPEEAVKVLHQALSHTLGDPAVRAALEAQNRDVSKPLTQEAAAKAYADSVAEFSALVKSVNFQVR